MDQTEQKVSGSGHGVVGRSWCVTLWGEDDVLRLKSLPDVVALVVGEEVAPSTGKVHFQTYVRFQDNKRLSWWKNQFPTAHVEKRKGSEWQAAEYCRKDARVLVDYGCEAKNRPTGDACVDALNLLEAGAPLWQVYRANRVWFFHNCRKVKDMDELMRSWREAGVDFISDGSSDDVGTSRKRSKKA